VTIGILLLVVFGPNSMKYQLSSKKYIHSLNKENGAMPSQKARPARSCSGHEADRFHFQLCSKLRLPLEAVGTKVFVLEFGWVAVLAKKEKGNKSAC